MSGYYRPNGRDRCPGGEAIITDEETLNAHKVRCTECGKMVKLGGYRHTTVERKPYFALVNNHDRR